MRHKQSSEMARQGRTPVRRMLRLSAVHEKTALPKSSIYQKIKEGTFPKPVRLGAKAVAWIESEIDAWIGQRVAQRDGAEEA